jgi:DNA polymerase
VKSVLKTFIDFGVDNFYSDTPINHLKDGTLEPTNDSNAPEVSASPKTAKNKVAANGSHPADNCKTLAELREAVEIFEGCAIKKTAANTVFADGSETAEIMMIGEAPGANEDKEGIPFCGQSGKLLNNILPSIGLKREDVYITNTIFWRPPGNRRPTSAELAACRPFVEKHIALLNPKIIVLVGSTAVESLLDSKVSMHDLRDNFYEYTNKYLSKPIKTAVIFHPSYLLRQPTKKKLMWFDMLRFKKYLESCK